MAASDLRFVTIVTYGRTGSTALQAAANAIPGVLLRGENYAAFRGLRSYVQSVAATANRHHAGRADHPWFGSARLDSGEVVRHLRDHVIETILRPRSGTQWLGFKEIRYTPAHWDDYDTMLDYLLFLNVLFPGMRYICNVRSADRASGSAWWREEPDALNILHGAEEWITAAHADLGAILGSDRSQLLHYEQWSQEPIRVRQAFSELGLPHADAAIGASLQRHLSHGPGTP
jgi:hypothetical protein